MRGERARNWEMMMGRNPTELYKYDHCCYSISEHVFLLQLWIMMFLTFLLQLQRQGMNFLCGLRRSHNNLFFSLWSWDLLTYVLKTLFHFQNTTWVTTQLLYSWPELNASTTLRTWHRNARVRRRKVTRSSASALPLLLLFFSSRVLLSKSRLRLEPS